jgi:Leucine-rich repeat (LRR) protein
MPHIIASYIERINDNDPMLTEINITEELLLDNNLNQLSDEDLVPLIEALNKNQEAAKRIIVLNLLSNNIININPLIKNLTSLIELNLSQNKIAEIDLSKLTNLLKLDLYYNKITGHMNLSTLTNLTFVNVADNDIESIFLNNCLKLEHIDVSLNNLTTFDSSIFNNLKYLDISFNNIQTLYLHHSKTKDLILARDGVFLGVNDNQRLTSAATTIAEAWGIYYQNILGNNELVADLKYYNPLEDGKEYSTICPISHAVMTNPTALTTSEVVNSEKKEYKHIFDKSSILTWFKSKETNPLNNLPCDMESLSPFYGLKNFIRDQGKLKAEAWRREQSDTNERDNVKRAKLLPN